MYKISRFIAILLSILLIISIASCGGKPKTANKSVQIIQGVSAQESTSAITPVSTAKINTDPEDIPVQLRILPANEFGRDEPFVPLLASASKEKMEKMTVTMDLSQEKTMMPKTIIKKPESSLSTPLPNVRLSLAIDQSTAIFEDNKSSKVASVGDTISGMKVLEIRGNEAVLGSGNKKYIVSQVGVREESSTPVSAPAKNTVPKGSKNKKK